MLKNVKLSVGVELETDAGAKAIILSEGQMSRVRCRAAAMSTFVIDLTHRLYSFIRFLKKWCTGKNCQPLEYNSKNTHVNICIKIRTVKHI